MLILPAGAALGLLLLMDGPSWTMWTVSGSFITSWWVTKAYRVARNDLAEGREADERVYHFWHMVFNVVVWVHWLICLVGIVVAIAA